MPSSWRSTFKRSISAFCMAAVLLASPPIIATHIWLHSHTPRSRSIATASNKVSTPFSGSIRPTNNSSCVSGSMPRLALACRLARG